MKSGIERTRNEPIYNTEKIERDEDEEEDDD